jgi:hypothetical protein
VKHGDGSDVSSEAWGRFLCFILARNMGVKLTWMGIWVALFCGNCVRESINLGERLIEREIRLIEREKRLIEREKRLIKRGKRLIEREKRLIRCVKWLIERETVDKLQIMVVTSPKLVGEIIYRNKEAERCISRFLLKILFIYFSCTIMMENIS